MHMSLFLCIILKKKSVGSIYPLLPYKAEVVRSEVEQAATSASPCASEQQLSPSAKLPEHEVAVGYDGDDDEDELIILPKDKSSKVSALGLERPGDG